MTTELREALAGSIRIEDASRVAQRKRDAIKEARERITLDMESGVILQLHKVTRAAHLLTKCLAVGYVDSEATAAIIELRASANFLEQTQRRYVDRMAETDRAEKDAKP